VVVFENKERGEVLGSGDAPTFDALAKRYSALDRYYGVTHPSLPNYLVLVSGSTQGITSDCTDCTVSARSPADTLKAARRTWKSYAESIPSAGFEGAASGLYAKKHVPFLYFRDAERRRVVPFAQFAADIRANRLPDFSLVTPNMCNSMHDCSVATGDAWLEAHIVPVLGSPALAQSVVFVVFDEGSSDTHGGGHVAALALGPLVRPRSHDAATLDHYSLLRTIEDAWKLPRLGRSAGARPITGIWR
jgi:phosphatidylinositol-3-phosphatase